MKRGFLWLLNAAVFISIGALGYRAFQNFHADKDEDDKRPAPATTSASAGKEAAERAENEKPEAGKGGEKEEKSEPVARITRSAAGESVITITPDALEKLKIKTAPLAATHWHPQTTGFGVLQIDPARSFTLRATVAGTLRDPPDGVWPTLGAHVAAGSVVGRVEPLLTPVERLDLITRLSQARSEVSQAEASLEAAESSLRAKQELHEKNGIVSDRALEEANAKVKNEQARLDAAREIVSSIEAARPTASRPAQPIALRVAMAGEVVDSPVMAGEHIDAGQVLLRTARFDRLLARVEIPAGEPIDESAEDATIATVDHPDIFLPARRVNVPLITDTHAHNRSLQYLVQPNSHPLRPGAAVTIYIPAGGAEESGVIIPRSAVVRMLGRTWAYVQTAPGVFARREVSTTRPAKEGWFCSSGFEPGQQVVTDGAIVLVSEELKPQGEAEGD